MIHKDITKSLTSDMAFGSSATGERSEDAQQTDTSGKKSVLEDDYRVEDAVRRPNQTPSIKSDIQSLHDKINEVRYEQYSTFTNMSLILILSNMAEVQCLNTTWPIEVTA